MIYVSQEREEEFDAFLEELGKNEVLRQVKKPKIKGRVKEEKTLEFRRDECLKIYDGLCRKGLQEEQKRKLQEHIFIYVVRGITTTFGIKTSSAEPLFDVYFINILGKRSGILESRS